MHPSIVRQVHAARVFHALRLNPLMSQRELVAKAGTDKSTISAIIKHFETEGLIERSPRAGGQGRGRPGEGLRIAADSGLLAGIHLRTGALSCMLAGLDGTQLGASVGALPERPADIGTSVNAALRALLAEHGRGYPEIRALGVSVSGLVSADGRIAQSPNLGWADIPLRDILAGALAMPFYIDNNTNAAALAEFLFGAAIDQPDFVYLESGSGVGAGLYLGGALYRGTAGFAGELGHMKIVPDGRLCRCGNVGCLSAYVSNFAIQQRLARLDGFETALPGIIDRARAADPTVQKVLDEAGRHLGQGIANIINILNPPLILLGGGLGELADFMAPEMRAAVDRLALAASRAGCDIARARFSPNAAPWGGVALALEGCTGFDAAEDAPW